MDKRLSLHLNANRRVTGVLRGFDPFMNLVMDEAVEEPRSRSETDSNNTITPVPMGLAVL